MNDTVGRSLFKRTKEVSFGDYLLSADGPDVYAVRAGADGLEILREASNVLECVLATVGRLAAAAEPSDGAELYGVTRLLEMCKAIIDSLE